MDDVVWRHVVQGDLVPGVDRLRGGYLELANSHALAAGQWAQRDGDIVIDVDAVGDWAFRTNVWHIIASVAQVVAGLILFVIETNADMV